MSKDTISEFQKLLQEGNYLNIPKIGDVVNGTIIGTGRKEVRIDIRGIATGVVRGREIFAESTEYSNLKPGESVEATVIDIENENGEMELSFRFAGQQKAWDELLRLFTTGEAVDTKILEANKGGLIISLQHVTGFLPVSQLSPEHYPRVSGGDKGKILEKLKSYIGSKMKVRVLDVNKEDEKLIVSEKVIWEDEQKNVLSQYKVGDAVEGEVTALADFGAFIKFDSIEGLVHISEIAWQRIDHPRDLLKINETVKAEIIGIEGSKIFLSMKKLLQDPWHNVEELYKIGDIVEGTVLKVNPFGFFIELDNEIHGLAHVSELSSKPTDDVSEIGKTGDRLKFRIVSISAKEHRLGLSIKAMDEKLEDIIERDNAAQNKINESKAEKTKTEDGTNEVESETKSETEPVTEKKIDTTNVEVNNNEEANKENE